MRPLVLIRRAQARQNRLRCSLLDALLSVASMREVQYAMWRVFYPSRSWR